MQALQHLSRDRIHDLFRGGKNAEDGRRWGVRAMEPLGDVQQLLVAQADERPSHKGAEGQRVEGVRKHAHQGQNVLGLLTLKERSTGLRSDGEARLLQRALVTPKVGSRRREQRYVARLEGRT